MPADPSITSTPSRHHGNGDAPYHPHPPRQPLTDEQIDAIQDKHMRTYPATPRRFARMIEAAHGIGKDVP